MISGNNIKYEFIAIDKIYCKENIDLKYIISRERSSNLIGQLLYLLLGEGRLPPRRLDVYLGGTYLDGGYLGWGG